MRFNTFRSLAVSAFQFTGQSSYKKVSFGFPHPSHRHPTSICLKDLRDSSNTMASPTLTHVSGIKELKDDYSTFLLDMWGVMHDGVTAYEGVLDTVKQLKNCGKKLIILSNSSKRKDNAMKTLQKLGFEPEIDIDEVITSGEISYRMLSGDETLKCFTWDVISNLRSSQQMNVFVFGSGDGDEEYCTSCGWKLSPLLDANLIIARGTFTINDGSGTIISLDDDETTYTNALQESLRIAVEKKIPMLVTNPDKVRPDADLSPMPGSIGDSYQVLLGEKEGATSSLVKRVGKPYSEVYELALNELGVNGDLSSCVMVGDALETDVTGGSMAKISTLWVTMVRS